VRRPETLVLAWGNPGRRDDGLGPACAARLGAAGLPGVRVEWGYQLQVEDADEVSRHERVVFVDADRARGEAPWRLERLRPARSGPSFSTHRVAPGEVLALAGELFGRAPEAWLLGIRGYDFEGFGEGLSGGAQANMESALEEMCRWLGGGAARGAAPAAGRVSRRRGEPCQTRRD